MTSSAGKPVPKPKPPKQVPRWFQEATSDYPWEQAGLDHVRALMPAVEPFRAWATFSFTANSGRINECDLFIAVPAGLFLVELKGHPGHVVNHGETWTFRAPDTGRVLTLRNPLHATDRKCKDLKTRLEQAARARQDNRLRRFPWIQPAVFLSAPDLRSGLDAGERIHVYGRDGLDTGLPSIWADLLGRPPQRDSDRITAEVSRLLPVLMADIGIRASTAHLDFADDWRMDEDVLDEGPTWQDRLAAQTGGLTNAEGRVRLYLTARQATGEEQKSVERAARREFEVLQGINHRGIAQAVQIRYHQGGPAVLFQHRAADLRLDAFLATRGAELAPEVRLDLVRQLAEAVRYAHDRSLYHRALAARSVYVSTKADGSQPVVRIIDWQAAARDFDTAGHTSLNRDPLTSAHIEDSAQVYLAPEFQAYADPVALDVFGLGALAHHVLTGQPPAALRSELTERLANDGGLHLSVVVDGVIDSLDRLVYAATRADWAKRLESAEAFLAGLDKVEQELAEPLRTAQVTDLLAASPGQQIDGDWTVKRVLGTGATARALLVSRVTEAADGTETTEQRVLKVALDAAKNSRLEAEYRALEQVSGGAVVQLFPPLREIGERTVLELEFAGERSLGAWLREEGRLGYHDLDRFGGDLFTALDQLAGKGIRHRDIKPDNLGVFYRADRSRQLKLFDFSLAGVPDTDTKAGTRGYLDPFLGDRRRPRFDDHAERYAVAVTLYQMAAGELPVWGDGIADPTVTTDETPKIAEDLFEPALRDELSAFFHRALHRDVDKRFDTARQMHEAWRDVFRVADAAAPASTPDTEHGSDESVDAQRDKAAAAAKLDTPLVAAGLSPRAQSVAATLSANTVAELLDVAPHEITRARGAGALARKELNKRHKQWSALRGTARAAESGSISVDELLVQIMPTARQSTKASVRRLTLGLPETADDEIPRAWQTQAEIAKQLGITQATVSRHQRAAAKDWAVADWLTPVRDEIVAILEARGRVSTVEELAGDIRVRHGAADAAPELLRARAMAVLRAAVEAETYLDKDSDHEPRLEVLRRGGTVLVALESLSSADPSAAELADYAFDLGKRADQLVAAADTLPGAAAVVRELRAVPAPDGLPAIADTRLVGLAARMSAKAAGSPRLELYPKKMGLPVALRLSQAAAGVRREPGISVDELLAKVRARFPELDLPARPTHVVVGDAAREAGFELEYDPTVRRFRAPARELPRGASSASNSETIMPGGMPTAEAWNRKLELSVQRGGFRALTVRVKYLLGIADALARTFPVHCVDFNRLFLDEFRALAVENGTDWSKVLTIDARFTETRRVSPGLQSYLDHTWQRVEERLLTELDERTVVLLHDAGLVARYFEAGGRETLVRLQKAARRPADKPYGLWLLCPGENPSATPRLDGRTVEIEDPSEQVVLSKALVDQLRGESAA